MNQDLIAAGTLTLNWGGIHPDGHLGVSLQPDERESTKYKDAEPPGYQ
jgi:hypothetical protein